MAEKEVKKENLRAYINAIAKNIKLLDQAIYEYEEVEKTPEDVAELLDGVRDASNWLKLLDSSLVSELRKVTPRDKKYITIKGGGTAEVKVGAPRKAWDHQRLSSIISEQIIDDCIDDESGLLNVPISQIPPMLFKYAHVDYWRKGELEKAGIDADDYCEKGEPTTSVIIRKSGGKYGSST